MPKIETQSFRTLMFLALGFLFLVAVHYYQAHPPGYGLEIAFNTFAWIPVGLFIGLGLGLIAFSAKLSLSKLSISLLIALGLLVIPSFYPASADFLSTGRYYALIGGFLFFLSLQQLDLKEEELNWLILLVLVAVLIQAGFGLYQYLYFEPGNWMNYDTEADRPYGIFAQPNVMASFLATGVALSAFLLPKMQGSEAIQRLGSLLCVLAPLALLPLVMLLHSRVGWLGSLGAIILLVPYLISNARNGLIIRGLCLAWAAMVFAGIGIGIYLLSSSPEGAAVAASKVSSAGSRTFIYPQVLRMIQDSPVLGVGIGNFESAYNLFAAELYAGGLSDQGGFPNLHHPHNELMYWMAEGGIVALLGLLFAAWAVFSSLLRAPFGLRLALAGLFFPIVLHTQTEYPFYHSITHWAVFLIFIFVVDFYGNERRELTLKSTILIGTPAMLIPLLTTLFMVTTLQSGAVIARHERFSDADVEELLAISNPVVWNQRLQWHLRTKLMLAGIRDGNLEPTREYLRFVESNIAKYPRRQSYQDLVLLYGFLGDGDAERRALAEAEYRYPEFEFFRHSEGEFRVSEFASIE